MTYVDIAIEMHPGVTQRLRKQLKGIGINIDSKAFILSIMSINDAIPSQHGEDYHNDSSIYTAEHYQKVLNGGDVERIEDFYPIIIDENNKIIDGNHRHCASKLVGFKDIYVWKKQSK